MVAVVKMTCTIDCLRLLDRSEAHDELTAALSLPAYYGRNLDALWDCVSTMEADVTLLHADALPEDPDAYANLVIGVLEEAEKVCVIRNAECGIRNSE